MQFFLSVAPVFRSVAPLLSKPDICDNQPQSYLFDHYEKTPNVRNIPKGEAGDHHNNKHEQKKSPTSQMRS